MIKITDYLAQVAPEHQALMEELYHYLQSLMPVGVTEKISYQMPAFYLGKPVVYFAAAKKHWGLYPTPGPIAHFAEELAKYPSSKGAIRFSYTEPLPKELLAKIVSYRLTEIKAAN